MRNHTVAILSGLALGAFIGYEFAGKLNAYPPYSWIANYLAQQLSGSASQSTGQ